MSSTQFEIFVFPQRKRFFVEKGSNLLEHLGLYDILIPSPCGGGGVCGKCAVWIGTLTSDVSHPPESFAQCRERFNLQERLACQVTVNEDLVLWVSERGKTQIYTDTDTDEVFPDHKLSTVQYFPFAPGVKEKNESDSDFELLEKHHIFPFSLDQIQDFPARLRNADWQGYITTFCERLIAFQPPGELEVRYALAFDLGTTTLAASLIDIHEKRTVSTVSRHNPQSTFGDDVIARLQKASESVESRNKLQHVIINTLHEMITELAVDAKISREQIAVIAVAGNTAMQQLFCKMDSTWLGFSPFTPVVQEYPLIRANELGMEIHPFGLVQMFPILGGFVGGDITAGIIATDMIHHESPSLLIDIGTNGEMVLWHDNRLLCAATAAGPAFEGARIKHGMTAAPGAIEKVYFDQKTGDLRFQTIGNQPARGICGSGLIDLAAELLRLGGIRQNGQMVTKNSPGLKDLELISQRLSEDEKNRFFMLDEHQKIVLTQQDVRQLQLASGAIRSGIVLLLREAGLQQDDLKAVYLAGGFGNYIRRANAQQLGILPSGIPTERIRFCGNTSLAGAKQILLSHSKFEMLHEIRRLSKHVDLSRFPDFQMVFAESMIFPTKNEES